MDDYNLLVLVTWAPIELHTVATKRLALRETFRLQILIVLSLHTAIIVGVGRITSLEGLVRIRRALLQRLSLFLLDSGGLVPSFVLAHGVPPIKSVLILRVVATDGADLFELEGLHFYYK